MSACSRVVGHLDGINQRCAGPIYLFANGAIAVHSCSVAELGSTKEKEKERKSCFNGFLRCYRRCSRNRGKSQPGTKVLDNSWEYQYGFIKVLAAEPGNVVIGLARNPQAAKDRLAKDSISNVHIIQGDITDVPSLKKAASEAAKILGDKGLDVLINNGAYVSDVTGLRSLDEE
jgi:hypothetical protein